MSVDKVENGKQYRYNGKDANGVNWFIPGSIVTITGEVSSPTPAASGPAERDDVGGYKCEKGQIINGYARKCSLEEIEDSPVNYTVSIVGNNTTITLQKRLNIEEVHAFLKAVGV